MDLSPLARVLATTDARPARMSRVLYLMDQGEGLVPAGYVDAVGDVATVLDRLETEGADGLAVQARVAVPDESAPRDTAVVAARTGDHAMAVADDPSEAAALDRAPRPGDPPALQGAWRLVVHALAALERPDAIPEPPDDPHPGAYLLAAWLDRLVASGDDATLDGLTELPDETALVADLGAPANLAGWDAVHALVRTAHPEAAARLGRNGVAWEAHELLAEPGAALSGLAGTGRVELADRVFADLAHRGWARHAPVDATPNGEGRP